jgi:molybdate transport system substrate-binding protein
VDGPAVKREIDAGEIFDVVVSLAPAMDDFVGQGKIVAGTRANIARRGVGVSVAVGAPKLDISSVEAVKSSVEAVKRTLLAAKTVAHSTGGSAGVYFKSLLERLGIAEQTKAKLKPMPGSTAAEAIVNGEADLLVAGNAETMVPSVQPVGLLPTALQNYIVFAARVVVATQHPEAAKDLIKSLAAAEAAQVITAKGMEPAVP